LCASGQQIVQVQRANVDGVAALGVPTKAAALGFLGLALALSGTDRGGVRVAGAFKARAASRV
jgi:hypothetical protein